MLVSELPGCETIADLHGKAASKEEPRTAQTIYREEKSPDDVQCDDGCDTAHVDYSTASSFGCEVNGFHDHISVFCDGELDGR